ncbi:hypothetical protein [Demequina gelatinilytica]|uniref:hypothetical protein n=1 Tax=Demequina gelatinilytica TaxID=1638980 RepID=UPI000783DA11|nr:hypothetical protein [Demequina gelatinilytica]
MTTVSTIGASLHEAMFQAARTLFDGEGVRVNRTPSPIEYSDSVVTMGRYKSTQEPATLGGTRGRDEECTVTMMFAHFEAGDAELIDDVARDAAFALLNRFAESLRSALAGDTTVGGTVLSCFLTEVDAESVYTAQPAGALWEIEAEFTAKYRIRG